MREARVLSRIPGWSRRRAAAAIAGVAASVLLLLAPVSAQAVSAPDAGVVRAGVDDFSFKSMDAQYTLGRTADGTSTLKVVETFVAVFPQTDQNHGMRRTIFDSYNSQPNFPKLISITDEHGKPREAETNQEDGTFSMTSRAPAFVHGTQTYVFTYTLRNVTWSFPDTGDEFYWQVNGLHWPQAFGRVSATVHMDAKLAAALTGNKACFHGVEDSTATCPIALTKNATGATASASIENVPAYNTLTIAVRFQKGTFKLFDQSLLASPWGWGAALAALGGLAAIAWAIVVRFRRLRDAPGRPTIIAEYEPPAGFDASLAAQLLNKTTKVVPAEVLEQAIRGSIRIVEVEHGLFRRLRLQAELIDSSLSDEDGTFLLDAMFADGPVYVFDKRDSAFAAAARRVDSWASGQLIKRGLRKDIPKRVRRIPGTIVFLLAAATIGCSYMAMQDGADATLPVILMVVAGLMIIASAWILGREPLSAAGAEARDHLKGLREFIEWAEADRIRMLQSPQGAERVPVDPNDPRQMLKLYEKLLPFAVMFGQEKEWSQQLAVRYEQTGSTGPNWYVGRHGFSAATFADNVGTLSAAAASSSSTSGGTGGGGSAGGGGGGGGGGGV